MSNKKAVSIVIPIYKDSMSEKESLSFQRILHVYADREISIACPARLKDYGLAIGKGHPIHVSVFPEKYFRNISGYNRLLMSEAFYNAYIGFEYILICQLDVMVIKDDLDYWVSQSYDNTGAPIFESYTKPGSKLKRGNNGGFCLRKTKSCLAVLSNIKTSYSELDSLWNMETLLYMKIFRLVRDGLVFNYRTAWLKPVINEDMFWSVIVPDKFPWYSVCGPERAKYFAFDANPRWLFAQCSDTYPMAIHAWWRYDLPFVKEILARINILV
jgi:Protein of unknown function (DUF5672)